MLSVKQEAMNANSEVIGLTRVEYTAPKADALTTRPSELIICNLSAYMIVSKKDFRFRHIQQVVTT